MVTKKITSKVIRPVAGRDLKEKTVERPVSEEGLAKSAKSNRVCWFCQNKSNPMYTDLVNLRRFLTDRVKIVAKERSGVCSKHQRMVAKNIKYARHLALLPFAPRV